VVTLAVETLAGAARLLAATRGPAAASLLFNLFEVPCGDSEQGGASSAFTVLGSCLSTTVVMTPTDCNQSCPVVIQLQRFSPPPFDDQGCSILTDLVVSTYMQDASSLILTIALPSLSVEARLLDTFSTASSASPILAAFNVTGCADYLRNCTVELSAMTNRSMGWNAVLCMQLATYASQFVLNGMPGLLQPLQCWAYTGRSLSLGGYFADAASCPEYLARVRSPDIVLLLTSALNLTCGDSLMASVNGGANPTQLATRLCITPGGSPPQPAPAPSPSSPDITLPCTASITVTSAVDRPWGLAQCDLLALFANQLYVDWLGPLIYNSSSGVLLPFACYSQNSQSLSVQALFTLDTCYSAQLVFVLPTPARLIASALNLTCGDSITGATSYNTTASKTWADDLLCNAPVASPPSPPSPPAADLSAACNVSVVIDAVAPRGFGASQCSYLADFSTQLFLDAFGTASFFTDSNMQLPFACVGSSSRRLAVSGVIKPGLACSPFLSAFNYSANTQLLVDTLGLGCGDTLTGRTLPRDAPSAGVTIVVNKVINYGIMFDASTCDHLASFASIVYLQHASIAALSAATATSAASVASRFTCTFSSPSVMIVSAVLSGSQANTSFFQALSNVAAAQLLAISFDLACGDSVSAYSATCGGFLTVQRELCIASPAPSPPLRPALPPPPSPLPSSRVCTIVTQIYQSTLRADPDGVPVQYTQGHCDHLAFYSNIMYLADIPRNTREKNSSPHDGCQRGGGAACGGSRGNNGNTGSSIRSDSISGNTGSSDSSGNTSSSSTGSSSSSSSGGGGSSGGGSSSSNSGGSSIRSDNISGSSSNTATPAAAAASAAASGATTSAAAAIAAVATVATRQHWQQQHSGNTDSSSSSSIGSSIRSDNISGSSNSGNSGNTGSSDSSSSSSSGNTGSSSSSSSSIGSSRSISSCSIRSDRISGSSSSGSGNSGSGNTSSGNTNKGITGSSSSGGSGGISISGGSSISGISSGSSSGDNQGWLTGPRLLSNFTCFFFSTNTLIVVASVREATASSTFFGAFNNTMAAELAGVAFNLGCGDQLHASSSCNGDVMFAGDTYCTVPNPEPPPPNTPPALPPSPSPSPPAPPTSRTPPPPAPTPPSPSPPPVSRPFPFSNCNRASDRSPWRMSLASQEAGFYNPASRVAGTRVCLVVFVNRTAAGSCRVDGGNTCCTMGMNKVDFNVGEFKQFSPAQAQAALLFLASPSDVTVNGEPASPAIFERTTPVMKITGLKTPYATGLIDGVEVCFTLDETSNCPTLSSLCGGTVCRYAVYNEPQRYNCCPVSMFDASQ
ncbi:hypothetical protein QJQ45_024419, partial [Haematococcus lacustris]